MTFSSASVEFRDVGKLREELTGALRQTLLTPDREAALTFAAKLRTLDWNVPAVRHRARSYAFALEHNANLPVPKPCADANSWAASGYRTLPGSTQAFVREYTPPRRLVIVSDPTPPSREHPRCTAPRYESGRLRSSKAVERKLVASLGSLAATRRKLEITLGFRAFRNSARSSAALIGVVADPVCQLLAG
jgi:hypothetical protein